MITSQTFDKPSRTHANLKPTLVARGSNGCVSAEGGAEGNGLHPGLHTLSNVGLLKRS